jgi:hypothetical protein
MFLNRAGRVFIRTVADGRGFDNSCRGKVFDAQPQGRRLNGQNCKQIARVAGSWGRAPIDGVLQIRPDLLGSQWNLQGLTPPGSPGFCGDICDAKTAEICEFLRHSH